MTGEKENKLVTEQLECSRKISDIEIAHQLRMPLFEVQHILRRLAAIGISVFDPIDDTWRRKQ